MQVKKQELELDREQQTSSKSEKEHVKAIWSPCLFNLSAEYIMRNAGLDTKMWRLAGADERHRRPGERAGPGLGKC